MQEELKIHFKECMKAGMLLAKVIASFRQTDTDEVLESLEIEEYTTPYWDAVEALCEELYYQHNIQVCWESI